MLKVTLPDGKTREYSNRVRPIDIAADIGPRLAKATLAAEVDGCLVGVGEPLPPDGQRDRNNDDFKKTDADAMRLNTMFSRLNLTLASLLLFLAGAVPLAGCETTGDNDTGAHNHSSGQGSCH